MRHEQVAATAEAIRISTREAQGLSPELIDDGPFQLVAALMRSSSPAAAPHGGSKAARPIGASNDHLEQDKRSSQEAERAGTHGQPASSVAPVRASQPDEALAPVRSGDAIVA
jgi:hypothetical protein